MLAQLLALNQSIAQQERSELTEPRRPGNEGFAATKLNEAVEPRLPSACDGRPRGAGLFAPERHHSPAAAYRRPDRTFGTPHRRVGSSWRGSASRNTRRASGELKQ